MGGITVAAMGIYSSISPFLELPSAALAGAGCWPRPHIAVPVSYTHLTLPTNREV